MNTKVVYKFIAKTPSKYYALLKIFRNENMNNFF